MIMKKMILIFLLSLVLFLCLCACNQKVGNVKIIADDQEYIPLSNWIFSLNKDGVAADGARKQPKEIADEIAAIPLKNSISILIDGKTVGQPYYSLFNDKFDEIYYGNEHFEVPAGKGEFICVFEVVWGNENQYEGYQYFFKFIK